VLPEEFRAYAILVDWSTHHWTIDAYVLDEDNEVLFTFEGNSAASEVPSLSHTTVHSSSFHVGYSRQSMAHQAVHDILATASSSVNQPPRRCRS